MEKPLSTQEVRARYWERHGFTRVHELLDGTIILRDDTNELRIAKDGGTVLGGFGVTPMQKTTQITETPPPKRKYLCPARKVFLKLVLAYAIILWTARFVASTPLPIPAVAALIALLLIALLAPFDDSSDFSLFHDR